MSSPELAHTPQKWSRVTFCGGYWDNHAPVDARKAAKLADPPTLRVAR